MKVLSVQDISCYGQCSLTVALPILSAMGIETPILPTAMLSTHTAGFTGFTFRDLAGDLPGIVAHWKKEGIRFDGVYTGYLGSVGDVEIVKELAHSELNQGDLIVDPAFGDNGKLYGGFDEAYVDAMRGLCFSADVLLPNLTEAFALLGLPYRPMVTTNEADEIARALYEKGAKAVVLKGIGNLSGGRIGILVYDGIATRTYVHPRLPKDSHGTGDVFASVFVGGYMNGLRLIDAGKLAADFTYDAIANTLDDPDHSYGVKFEPLLATLPARVQKLSD